MGSSDVKKNDQEFEEILSRPGANPACQTFFFPNKDFFIFSTFKFGHFIFNALFQNVTNTQKLNIKY